VWVIYVSFNERPAQNVIEQKRINGFLNARQLSGDRKFLDAAVRNWEWIKNYMIEDYEYGEWYGNASSNCTPRRNGVKTDQWRWPCHNGRIGFEVMTRFP